MIAPASLLPSTSVRGGFRCLKLLQLAAVPCTNHCIDTRFAADLLLPKAGVPRSSTASQPRQRDHLTEDQDCGRPSHSDSDRVGANSTYRIARDIVLNRGKEPAETVARVAAAGFSTEHVLDVAAECAFAGLVGVMDNLADRVDLDGFLAPRAWQPSRAR